MIIIPHISCVLFHIARTLFPFFRSGFFAPSPPFTLPPPHNTPSFVPFIENATLFLCTQAIQFSLKVTKTSAIPQQFNAQYGRQTLERGTGCHIGDESKKIEINNFYQFTSVFKRFRFPLFSITPSHLPVMRDCQRHKPRIHTHFRCI